MEESGISRAVVMGRKADEYGEVDNEDILELARAYPQTFIPFAGLNPYDADLPDRVDARPAGLPGRVPRRWLAAVLRQPP
ncbi:MAG: hypothetical protein ACLRWP_01935 [Bilophila wadsworthia]